MKLQKIITNLLTAFIFVIISQPARSQSDSAETIDVSKMITLSEVVVRNGIDVPTFLQRVKNDSTFYKAFRTLHIVGFTSLNDIRMLNKDGTVKATLQSKTRQNIAGGCRTMDVLEETTTGNIYDKDRNWNYTTAEMYAGLFFTKDKICNENNIVKGIEFSTRSKSGIEKHKEQLKMLFFNPGKKIPGIPFIGNKINVFDPGVAKYYDFSIDFDNYNGEFCYVFNVRAKSDLSSSQKDQIVIDNMTSWFNTKTMEVVGRTYDLSYDAGLYDFEVHMEVQMTHFENHLIPKTIYYNGNWDVPFKKRERGVFTATLFDFKK
jgi:hypothetical protein